MLAKLTFLQFCSSPTATSSTAGARTSERVAYFLHASLEGPGVLLLVLPDGVGTDGLFLHLQRVDHRVTYGLDKVLLVSLQNGVLDAPRGRRK